MGSAGFVTLMRYAPEPGTTTAGWKSICNQKVDAATLAPGVPHKVEVIVDVARLGVKIDEKSVLRWTLREGTFGSGRFGIGSHDARVLFKDIVAQSF
jgi:hypothetical protein